MTLPKYVTQRQMKELVGVPYSRQDLTRKEARPVDPFPQRIRLSEARIVYETAAVLDWIERRKR